MRGILALLSLLLALLLLQSANADYEQVLEYTEKEGPTQSVQEHRRSKRSPYDPLIPALLLGKSAFLLGTVLGPQLLHRPYHHRRPHYHRRSYHGGYGGYGGYGGGGYYGWK